MATQIISSDDEEFHDLEVLQRVFEADPGGTEDSFDRQLVSAEANADPPNGSTLPLTPQVVSQSPSASDLSLLESNFILFDKFHGSFHCAKCFLVLSTNCTEHFRRIHKILFHAERKSQINLLLTNFARNIEYTPGYEVRKFQFLPVKVGYQCCECFSIFQTIKNAKRRCKRAHNSEHVRILFQNLGHNGKPLYIRVQSDFNHAEEEQDANRDTLDAALNDVAEILKPPQAPESQHQRNIFYVERGWFIDGDQFENYDMRKIVKVPKEGDADYLFFDHVTDVFIDVLKNMHKIDEQLRRALRDPVKNDEDHRGRFHLLTSPNSVKLYAKFFGSFILGMRRMIENPSRELRIDISIERLITALGETPSIDRIFRLLSAVIREFPAESADSSMIGIVFLRFFCQKPFDSSLRQPHEITTFCSKFIYLIKLTVLMELTHLADYSAKRAYLERNSKVATGTAFNLKGRIQLIRTDAYEADKGSNFNPAICIPDLMNPFQFLYNSVPFSSENIQAAYSKALERALAIQELLLHGCQPMILESEIHDKTVCKTNGYSMRYGPSEESNLRMKATLIYHLESTNQLESFGRVAVDGKFHWNCSVAGKLLRLYDEFIEMIILIIHIGSGMPARATELATYSISNTASSPRVAYFLGKKVYFLCLYNKTRGYFGTAQPIARFLDDAASRIFLKDYLVIRPFIAIIAGSLNLNEKNVYMQMVFVQQGQRLESERIAALFSRNFGALSGVSILFHDYRQITTYFGRQLSIVEEAKPRKSSAVTANQITFAAQQGHSEQTEIKHYGRSDQDHSSSSEQILAAYMRLSIRWHEFINRRVPTNHLDSIYEGEKLANETLAKRFRENNRISEDLILFSSTKMNIVKSTDSLILLKRLLGERATFRSVHQQQAVDHVLHRNEDLLCILPTGCGKSIIFFLKALQHTDKSIILVVPYLSLIQDIVSRVRQLGLAVCTDYSCFQGEAILILTPETTISASFRAFLALQGTAGNISAIFLDEAHVFVTDVTYRHSLEKLEYLRIIPVPLICLTATCPFPVQKKIVEKLYNAVTPTIIHQSTDRPNLEYIVLREKNDTALIQKIRLFMQVAQEGERMIVYFNSIRALEAFAEMSTNERVAFRSYFATMGEGEKTRSFQDWKEGSATVMLATSAFGSGIDYPSVRQVIVFGLPYTIEEYSQMMGRGGRDGKRTKCVLMFNSQEERRRISWYTSNGNVQLANVLEKLFDYCVDHLSCRRAYISRYLDGMEVQCLYNASNALCSNCQHLVENHGSMRGVLRGSQRTSVALERQAKLTREKYNAENQFANELQYFLRKVKGKCTICIARGDFEGSGHGTLNCRDMTHRCYNCWDESHYTKLGRGSRVRLF